MKLNKKFFTVKSYKCNISSMKDIRTIFFFGVICFSMLMILTGCNNSEQTNTSQPDKTVSETKLETQIITKAKNRSLEIANFYKSIYVKAEKTTSDTFPNETTIPQKDIYEIESLLIEQGYSVINTDNKYPAYLENNEGFYSFWKSVCENKKAEQEFITVTETGGLYYSLMLYSNGEKNRVFISVDWDKNNEPMVSSNEYQTITDWELSDKGDFYYKSYFTGVPFDDYALIRLKPVDKTLYDLTDKYISPIGYLSNNMFVCDWTSDDYGDLAFNDLLEFFYKVKYNAYFNAQDYESIYEPYYHSNIPAELYEKTVFPYFDISLEEFRVRSLYDAEHNTYPWQEICCENVTYYPSVEPEVIRYQDNKDGTFTLTVNARCNDYKTDRLFTHEVIIRPLSDDEYKYLSNHITYRSDFELPPNYPRLPPLRINNASE